jgi:hypothetical protein
LYTYSIDTIKIIGQDKGKSSVSMKNAVFWDVQLVFLHRLLQLLVTGNVVSSLLILFTLTLEMLHSSEMLVLTKAMWHHVPEDGILDTHSHKNLKTYIMSI